MPAGAVDGSPPLDPVVTGAPPDDPPGDGVRYATQVTAVGAMIPEFRAQGLLVFFGELAPEELHDFTLLHRPTVVHSAPHPGDVIELGGAARTITAVGDVVVENLLRLGHFSLKADGATVAPMPGDVCVEVGELPELAVGAGMRILARPNPVEHNRVEHNRVEHNRVEHNRVEQNSVEESG
jgi:glucitol/sorbitol PTS system EIIA component